MNNLVKISKEDFQQKVYPKLQKELDEDNISKVTYPSSIKYYNDNHELIASMQEIFINQGKNVEYLYYVEEDLLTQALAEYVCEETNTYVPEPEINKDLVNTISYAMDIFYEIQREYIQKGLTDEEAMKKVLYQINCIDLYIKENMDQDTYNKTKEISKRNYFKRANDKEESDGSQDL